MVLIDSVPVVAHLKALIQSISGDDDGARETLDNFAYRNTLPVISQLTSAGHAIAGDLDIAREVQEEFLRDMSAVADGIPVVGHVKGSIHYAMGDNEKGDESMKSASRSVGVAVGGAVGFVAGGPAGAVAGGIVGGGVADTIISTGEVVANGPDAKPYGTIASIVKLDKALKGEGDFSVQDGIDAGLIIALDGVGGAGNAKLLGKPFAKTVGKTVAEKTVLDTIPYIPSRGAVVEIELE
jgi:hypothetical protein